MSKKNLIILAILGTLCLWLWSNSGSVVKTYKIGAVVERFIPDFLYLNLFQYLPYETGESYLYIF